VRSHKLFSIISFLRFLLHFALFAHATKRKRFAKIGVFDKLQTRGLAVLEKSAVSDVTHEI
jgi:hypothetical protein